MNGMTYEEFIASKRVADAPTGLTRDVDINPQLFDFQQAIVRWALRRGRAAIWADCGLGKTPMQLEWARHIPGRVLIAAPLAVGPQTQSEGDKFRVRARYLREDDENERIVITNYEILDRFDPKRFTGVVLDESSILKSYTGKTRTEIITKWGDRPFRLACTATPAPNDYMELGNHSEFIGAMRGSEMLSSFFINDAANVGRYRVKGHAESEFWRWLCSWAVMVKHPADIGFHAEGFTLPKLNIISRTTQDTSWSHEMLFPVVAATLAERLDARRRTIRERCEAAADIINEIDGPCIAWCNLNQESELLCKLIKGAVEVTGSQPMAEKETLLQSFSRGFTQKLVTKPTIAGFGMNWQHCCNMVFVGLSDSYEQFYQALRRCWRFGQQNPVNAYIVTADTEGAVVANIKRKEADANRLSSGMADHMADTLSGILHGKDGFVTKYRPKQQLIAPQFA